MNNSNKVRYILKLTEAVDAPAVNGILKNGNIKLTKALNITAAEDNSTGAGNSMLVVANIAIAKQKANIHIQKLNIYDFGTIL